MKEIRQAAHMGYCFGVKQAIALTESVLDREGRAYCCGSLIHNKTVTDELSARGLRFINSPEEAEAGATVIVRSHGEPAAFYAACEARGLKIEDATCPFVQKIHRLVAEAHEAGKSVVIVGDAKHPEVQGINGWCKGEAVVVNSREEAEKLYLPADVLAVAQTTTNRELWTEIREALLAKGVAETCIADTICNATAERQKACKETAENCDAMVVVGDKESSNTKKLCEIAKKYCKTAYFVENAGDLCLQEISQYDIVGITAGASTPQNVILEVIARMSEVITENKEIMSMDDAMEAIDEQLRLPRTGEIVTGTVIQVSNDEVVVNLNRKKDGIIPASEVTLEEGQKLTDVFKVDDEVKAKVIKTDEGEIILSKKKLEVNANWDEIEAAMESKEIINVKVIRPARGGVIAAFKEATGFIPLSQLSDKFVENADEFIGQVLPVRVTRVDKEKARAVFSHKVLVAEERAKRIAEVWNSLKVGDIVEGTVMRFTDYGAFVDVGGIDGLLHISEISWGKLKNPQEVLSIGQTIPVKILKMDEEKGKISLGYKQTQPEPWEVIDEKFHEGDEITGKVVQIKDYGAFIELEPGLDGLVHISEVAHKRVANIADEISVGQQVQVKVLEIDKEKRRISLSIKACLPEPEIFESKEAPAAEAPAEAAPVEEAPAEAPVEEAPVEEAPVEAPAEE